MEARSTRLKVRDTYRTLDEQAPRLSPAEERFERGRRTIGLFLGPLLSITILAVVIAVVISETTSHTASATIVVRS